MSSTEEGRRGPGAYIGQINVAEGGQGVLLVGGPPPARRVVSLPSDARAAPFTGRAEELAALEDSFSEVDRGKLLILHGKPGVGKSRLALEFATRRRDRYPGTWCSSGGTARRRPGSPRWGASWASPSIPTSAPRSGASGW